MRDSGPILAFDTSGPFCAAALLRGGEVLWQGDWHGARGQAEQLFPLLEDGLAQTGLTWADLTRLGVGVGPGNFTGIRIAVSAARGLALSLGIPAIGVSRLEAQVLDAPRPAVSLVAAPRGSAYVQTFLPDGPHPPALHTAADLATLALPADASLLGVDLAVQAESLNRPITPPPHLLAVAIATIAARAPADSPRPSPLYLRAADAAPASDPPPKILS
ncbi:tRNA (adenosine(37)-N6)-threonylcarbamoyltransferase complex dimerization subunit type 1 TsaB [Meridianimarinicoccus sp. MJW13]|uniref:tRNA (adenosine(37)-N6)-threonylcarbamoyltransferase complex dimerization subunit type 1 TsaB n=1 Tax=Meridianimarinicoccus sp. MJW13 TaxID=2720031 RepID=UPI0018682B17|nr:tRNA (adenosine(37)-N6)-threonylcarbamoyltransferase complex dimerization subunit type 1 TsaB [Fluviibacterium sp. MJW13]